MTPLEEHNTKRPVSPGFYPPSHPIWVAFCAELNEWVLKGELLERAAFLGQVPVTTPSKKQPRVKPCRDCGEPRFGSRQRCLECEEVEQAQQQKRKHANKKAKTQEAADAKKKAAEVTPQIGGSQ